MRHIKLRKRTIAVSVIALLVVIVGAAAVIGAVRSGEAGSDSGGVAFPVSAEPALGDDAGRVADGGEMEKSLDAGEGAVQDGAAPEGVASDVSGTLPPLIQSGQHLVRSGQLTVVVGRGKLHATVSRVTTVTRSYEGYVLSSMVGTWSDGGVEPYPATLEDGEGAPVSDDTPVDSPSAGGAPYAYITVRIPAQSFDEALAQLQKLGRVRELSTSTDDVTAHIVDLRARLRHYRAVEERLLSFLDKADTVAAALAVQDRIDRTQLMVEEIEAQLKQLDETVAYSTLSISLSERGHAVTAVDDDATGFWGAITNSLRLVGDGFRWIGVALGAALPFLVVFGAVAAIVIVLARRIYRRRRHDGPSGPTAPLSTGDPATLGGSEAC
jgi:hypothetical protein